MSDAEAETMFRNLRWPETNGAPVCPHCGSLNAYDCRRPTGAPRFRCRECEKDFSITSGTLFASHKLALRVYLAAIAVFCNEVKGKAALALSRDMGVSYKAGRAYHAFEIKNPGAGRITITNPDFSEHLTASVVSNYQRRLGIKTPFAALPEAEPEADV